jgi:hypothetical protein
MDDTRTHRKLLQFGLRDIGWAVLVVGLALGWWLDHRESARRIKELQLDRTLPIMDIMPQRQR